MKRLIQVENFKRTILYDLKKSSYTIGRGDENDIIIDENRLSRLHAQILSDGDGYMIVDKNSRNHTYVNGERVMSRRLIDNDVINLSKDVTFIYQEENPLPEPDSKTITNRDLLRLKDVTERIVSLDGLDKILDIILTEVIEIVNADRGFIALIDDLGAIVNNSRVIRSREGRGDEGVFSQSVVQQAIAGRTNIFIKTTPEDSAGSSDSIIALQLMSVMCSPLIFGGKLVGILYVDSPFRFIDFSPSDQFLFTILSDHAAIAIENAKLYSNAQRSIDDLREEVGKSNEKLLQALKMASLGQLVTGIAHEINTPLGVGITASSTLAAMTRQILESVEGAGIKKSELSKYLTDVLNASVMIQNNLTKAGELVKSFKMISADSGGRIMRRFKIYDLINGIILSQKDIIGRHKIHLNSPVNLRINNNPYAFGEIFGNLINNSVSHAFNPDTSGNIEIKVGSDYKKLHISYSDDGRGIPSDDLKKVFDPFFTTKRGEGHTGLGLSIVYNIVSENLKGTIECRSVAGNGAAFIISIPLEEEGD